MILKMHPLATAQFKNLANHCGGHDFGWEFVVQISTTSFHASNTN